MFQYKYVKTRRGRFGGIYNLLQRNQSIVTELLTQCLWLSIKLSDQTVLCCNYSYHINIVRSSVVWDRQKNVLSLMFSESVSKKDTISLPDF